MTDTVVDFINPGGMLMSSRFISPRCVPVGDVLRAVDRVPGLLYEVLEGLAAGPYLVGVAYGLLELVCGLLTPRYHMPYVGELPLEQVAGGRT